MQFKFIYLCQITAQQLPLYCVVNPPVLERKPQQSHAQQATMGRKKSLLN